MDASSEKRKGKEKMKEKEKASENGGRSRKLWLLELEMAERMENEEKIDTDFERIDYSFCPKIRKRLKKVEVQNSMEELCTAFDNNNSIHREEMEGQQNTSNPEELQLQEMAHQEDMRNISETDPSKNAIE